MGNSSSSSSRAHQDDTVDFGHLTPQGVYTGPQDWNHTVVTQLICARRLAPFYRPLEDYDDSWTDDQILAARRTLLDSEQSESSRAEATQSSLAISSAKSHTKRPSTLKDPARPEAAIYRGAVECPICFLYYPPNINHSRCCDQAICTECFVQIKRSEPTTTHLVSEPAACPYCVQDNFGIVYTPPPWRAGIGSDGSNMHWIDTHKGSSMPETTTPTAPTHKRRQKSFNADSPEVVTIDHIRPDWEAKLAAVQAAVTRRANRRIIMRQVGDRLIPVGITSGRVHALSSEEAGGESSENNGGSRRSRRRQQHQPGPFEQYLGQDLEELMLMEAMRLSLIEHEEQQRKEAEEKKKKEKEVPGKVGSSADNSEPNPGPSTSPATNGTTSSSSTPTPPQSSGFLHIRPKSRSPSPATRQVPASTWNEHRPAAPTFSTLNAALSTTSTARAILNSNGAGEVNTHDSTPETPESASKSAGSQPEAAESQTQAGHQANGTSEPRPEPIHMDSTVSESTTVVAEPSYEHLPSSPESSQEPLISKTAASEEIGEPASHVGCERDTTT